MPAIGILGGTFDPIHLGHLAIAEGAIHLARLERVLLVPNRQPPHKADRVVTSAEHRSEMVRLAIAGNPRLDFSAMELAREGPSYTIDTIRACQACYPDWQVFFLVGMDSLMAIQTWRDYETLLTLTDLLVVTRPGYPTEQGVKLLSDLPPALTARVRILEIPGIDISSTDLRRLAMQGYPLRYLVPDAVAHYIREHRLYA